MSFKAKNAGNQGQGGNFEPRITVVPKAGPRKARVSLIVDLGIQKREDFEDDKTGETRPQRPCQQVAVFADLVQDVVDYGGNIGKAQYRLCLNKTFGGETTGINFTTTPPKDANGKIIDGKPWAFHPLNVLTKLANAVGKPEVCVSTDLEELLDQPFIADVEVKETAAKGDKKDKDGNPLIYKNVNFKGASKVPMVETDELDEDGNAKEVPATIAPLKQPARCVTFDSATKEDIAFIRVGLIRMIKLAEDYAGSNMQKAIEAYEAEHGVVGAKPAPAEAPDASEEGEPESQAAPKQKVTPAKKPAAKKPIEKPAGDEEEDLPF